MGIWGMIFFSDSLLKRGGGGTSSDRYLLKGNIKQKNNHFFEK